MNVRQAVSALLLLAAVLAASAAGAAIWDPFGGYIDVSAVQADVNDAHRESVRQDYNVFFDKRLAPYVDMRLAYRYYHFDQDLDLALGSYRKEVQPSGELRWNHPAFLASTSLFHRQVELPGDAPILTNSVQAVFKTKDRRYPLFEARYDAQHTYEREDDRDRSEDIRNRRIQLRADYERPVYRTNYTFSVTESENIITDLKSDSWRHLFRWSGTGRVGAAERTRISGNYTFSHTTQNDEVLAVGGSVLRPLPVRQGLYALDDSPDFGILQPRGGLADGNTDAPVVPNIDIGGSFSGHNLGADLGGERLVGALHVYTDRPSGNAVTWSVWGSQDNQSWDLVATAPPQGFNTALNRYELTLPVAATYRYFKAVNSGLNTVAQVLVTELTVLELVSETSEKGLQFVSHQLDARVGHDFNERWQGAADASLQFDENPGRSGDRARASLGARLGFEPSEVLLHSARWELSNQWNEGGDDLAENMLGYSLFYDPLETLRGSLSVTDRLTWLERARSRHRLGAATEASADLLRGLLATLGASASSTEDYLSDRRYNTWNVRGRVQAALTDELDLVLDASYLESLETVTDDLRKRRDYGVGLDWRVTRDLYARASIRQTSEQSDRALIDALLSWAILPALRLSVQHYELTDDDLTTTLRRSANLDWELGARTNIYLRLAEVDLSGGGGDRTTSFQQGFRMGF
jgi:hypothetical protein